MQEGLGHVLSPVISTYGHSIQPMIVHLVQVSLSVQMRPIRVSVDAKDMETISVAFSIPKFKHVNMCLVAFCFM